MGKGKKTIREEIKNHLYMILNLVGVEKSVADKIVSVGAERIIEDVLRKNVEYFIMKKENNKKQIKNIIEGMKKKDRTSPEFGLDVENRSYNKALDDVLSELNK